MGIEYKTNIVWLKVRKDGGPDGRGVGFYYRNVTELVLFGTRGQLRTLKPGRRMVNFIATMKEKHSTKPLELYDMIEQCSPGPFVELFARASRPGWTQWGNEAPKKQRTDSENQEVSPRPMENGMIRPYRVPQFSLFSVGPQLGARKDAIASNVIMVYASRRHPCSAAHELIFRMRFVCVADSRLHQFHSLL